MKQKGYAAHGRWHLTGEDCVDCRAEEQARAAYLRFRRGVQHHPRYCKDCGSVFLDEHRCHLARR